MGIREISYAEGVTNRIYPVTYCSEVNWSVPPDEPKPRQTLGSPIRQAPNIGRNSTQYAVKCGQDVGRKHNRPDRISKETLVRPVIFGAPGGI